MTLYSGGSDYSNDKGCYLRKNYDGSSAYIRYNQANARTVNFIFGSSFDGICCPQPHAHCSGSHGISGFALGLMGGLMNLFTGFSYRAFSGFSNWSTGFGNNLLSYSSLTRGATSSTGYYADYLKHNGSNKVIEKVVNKTDSDASELNKLLAKVTELRKRDDENGLTASDAEIIEALKKEINDYKLLDNINSSENNDLKAKILELIPEINKDTEAIKNLEDEVNTLVTNWKATGGNNIPEGLDELLARIKNYTLEDSKGQSLDNTKLKNLERTLTLIKSGKNINSELLDVNNIINAPLANLNSEKGLSTLISQFALLSDRAKEEIKDKLTQELQRNTKGDFKCSRDYETLLKLELLGKIDPSAIVGVEYYSESSDKWIKGTIENVRKDKNGKINYNVNCAKTGDIIKANWAFRQNDNNTATIIGSVLTEDSTNQKVTSTFNMIYDWNEEEGRYENNNNKKTSGLE